MNQITVYVVFGSNEYIQETNNISAYNFDTQSEADAFKYGIDEAVGYFEAECFDCETKAQDYINEIKYN